MKNLKNMIFFPILVSSIILNFTSYSQEPKEKANLLTQVSQIRPIQEIIVDYLHDEWNLHKHFKEQACNIVFLDDDRLAFTYHDSNIYIINIKTSEKKILTADKERIEALTFLPNKKYVVGAERLKEWHNDGDRKIKIWDITTGNCIKTLDGHKNRDILSLAYSNDEKFIASGSMGPSFSSIHLKGSEVKIWDIETGNCIKKFALDRDNQIDTLIFSNDGNYLFTGSHSGYIRLLDLKTGKDTVIDASRLHYIRSFNFSNNGKLLIHAGGNDKIRIFNIENLEKVHEANTFTSKSVDNISDVQFSPNGKYIVAAGYGNEKTDHCGLMQIFDSKAFNNIKTFVAHIGIVRQILFSPNGKYLASIGSDGFIKIWKNRPDELLEEFNIYNDEKNKKKY